MAGLGGVDTEIASGAPSRPIQRRGREPTRRRPGFLKVDRPGQLWYLDMTSVWVASPGDLVRMMEALGRADQEEQLEAMSRVVELDEEHGGRSPRRA